MRVHVNKKTETISVEVHKIVVSTVENPDTEISLKKALSINKKLKVGDELWTPFEEPIGELRY